MKRVFSFFLFSFLMSLVALAQDPQGVKNIDLPDMYRQIDEAISQSPRYIADYEEKISKAKQALETANEEQRLMQLMEISRMYESFCGDSAQVYTERALELARQDGYNEIEGECMARLAYLCTFLGSQTESLTLLGRMSPHALSSEALVTYYRAYMMVYNNLSNNTQLQQMRQEFGELYACYMDSLLATAPEGSEMYCRYREPQLVGEGRLEEALKMNTQRLNMTTDGSHENAIVCYSRYTIYREMGDMEMAKYWLCRSALDDVRNAVLDQMSLIALAELLEAEGATERASRYIRFTWECNRRYSPPYSDYLGRRSVATVYILCHRFVLSLQAAKATESSTPTIGRHQQTSGRYQQQAETDERLGEQKQCRMAGRKQETEGENT